jgi:2-C-methyl-D-erythritol 4-phosphate cytidylyltransferase
VRAWGIVVAGGRGTRFGRAKQLDRLAGRPLINWAVDALRPVCEGVVVVLDADLMHDMTVSADAVVKGGATRAASVRAGLEAVPGDAEAVLVHDAVRPLATSQLAARVLAAVIAGADGAVPGVAVVDTLKRIDGSTITATVDRSELVAVQTPQAFLAHVLRRAHAAEGDATDDAGLVEAAGGVVVVVEGERDNRKVTWPEDLAIAEALLASRVGR